MSFEHPPEKWRRGLGVAPTTVSGGSRLGAGVGCVGVAGRSEGGSAILSHGPRNQLQREFSAPPGNTFFPQSPQRAPQREQPLGRPRQDKPREASRVMSSTWRCSERCSERGAAGSDCLASSLGASALRCKLGRSTVEGRPRGGPEVRREGRPIHDRSEFRTSAPPGPTFGEDADLDGLGSLKTGSSCQKKRAGGTAARPTPGLPRPNRSEGASDLKPRTEGGPPMHPHMVPSTCRETSQQPSVQGGSLPSSSRALRQRARAPVLFLCHGAPPRRRPPRRGPGAAAPRRLRLAARPRASVDRELEQERACCV